MLESFDQSEELQMFREAVRKMSEKEFAPIAAQIDDEDAMPDKVMPLLRDMGLVQLQVSEAYEGPGGTLLMNCIAKEEVARHSFAVSHLVGACDFAMVLPLRAFGTEEQRRHFLPQVATGNITAAIGLTEPGTGSDVSGIKTTARRDGDHWVINGQKTFITKGDTAKFINVIARTSEGTRGGGLSSFLVEQRTPGLTIGGAVRKMGLRGIKSVDLFFDDLRVPAENMIGAEGQGFKNTMHCLNYNRPTVPPSPPRRSVWPRVRSTPPSPMRMSANSSGRKSSSFKPSATSLPRCGSRSRRRARCSTGSAHWPTAARPTGWLKWLPAPRRSPATPRCRSRPRLCRSLAAPDTCATTRSNG